MITEILGYHFNNKTLLTKALTHPSLCINSNHYDSYERLEFLGDAVLNFVITEILIMKFPEEKEGDLAKRKANLVAGEILAKIALETDIADKILMSEAESKSGGRQNLRNLEDSLEAILGAIYLDGGLENLKLIIAKLWTPYLAQMNEVPMDPKSKLQEILQSKKLGLPQYVLIDSFGPEHSLTFKVSLKISGFKEVIGEGKSKQQAEKNAAKLLLEQINE